MSSRVKPGAEHTVKEPGSLGSKRDPLQALKCLPGDKQEADNRSGDSPEDPHARVCAAVRCVRVLEHRVGDCDPDYSCGPLSQSFAGEAQHAAAILSG